MRAIVGFPVQTASSLLLASCAAYAPYEGAAVPVQVPPTTAPALDCRAGTRLHLSMQRTTLKRDLSMKVRVAEVSYEDRIDEYDVVADDNIRARGLVIKFLGDQDVAWKSIRVRDTSAEMDGPARVIGRRE
jgi:hypothetical protein